MAESLESFKSYIGKSEKATDVVTASAVLKFAATLGQERSAHGTRPSQSRRVGTGGFSQHRTGHPRCV